MNRNERDNKYGKKNRVKSAQGDYVLYTWKHTNLIVWFNETRSKNSVSLNKNSIELLILRSGSVIFLMWEGIMFHCHTYWMRFSGCFDQLVLKQSFQYIQTWQVFALFIRNRYKRKQSAADNTLRATCAFDYTPTPWVTHAWAHARTLASPVGMQMRTLIC